MSKKTETIEIRVSPELKSAIAEKSADSGRSMSETIRQLIEAEAAGRPIPQPVTGDIPMTRFLPKSPLRAIALSLPVLILAALYLVAGQAPATASANAEARIVFAELDRDGDARITQAEVEAMLTEDGWQPDPACSAETPPADLRCTLAAEAAMHLARADHDGNGAVVFSEIAAVLTRELAQDFLDTDIDENGVLTVDELVAIEIHWAIDAPEDAAEAGLILSDACRTQFAEERLAGLAETCGFAAEGRIELASFDIDRDGRITLPEYLAQ